MKNSRTPIHLVIGLEGLVLVAVIAFALLNPIKNAVVDNSGSKDENPNVITESTENDTQQENSDNTEEQLTMPVIAYSDAVRDKVMSMSIEQRVAQMFVTTPEQLTGMRQVTATGNTTRNKISAIPVGGLIYSALNFEGSVQTASMTEALQNYYTEQFGFPLYMMVAETGGAEGSPLASANGFAIEASPAGLGEGNDAEIAKNAATNIAAYMQNQGLNTNIGIGSTYSADETVNAAMLDATVSTYKEAGIYTASTVYHSDADIIFLGDAVISEQVYSLRYEKQYTGVLLANTVSDAQSMIDAINAGADMVYCQAELGTTYQAVVDAVNNGTINEELINEAVMRILTYKDYE